jgi:hypothetical protein
MAWTFGDSFDLYAAVADMPVGYWDSGTVTNMTLVAGRFTGSQALQFGQTSTNLVKSSGSNDAVHHIVCAFRQTAVLSGTTLGGYFQFSDGVTNQCCIVFRSDGAILLTSATPGGTVLATYTGAVTAVNTWYAFEFEVVINNTTGSFTVRKNGNTGTADFTATSLNTRPGTNNYANKLTLGLNALVSSHQFDDVLWRSDTSSVTWVGDIRCYTRMPASDASIQFTKGQSPYGFSINSSTSSVGNVPANTIWFVPFTAPQGLSGLVQGLTITTSGTVSASTNMAIYDAAGAGGAPGNLVATATPIPTTLPSGQVTFSFATPPTLTRGAAYYAAFISSAITAVWYGATSITSGYTQSFTYSSGSFPATATPVAQTSHNGGNWLTLSATPLNSALVSEPQQDAATSYVYDSTVNDADFYNIGSIPVTPVATIAVTTRAFAEKSDAGTRSGAVQLKSGSSTVASPSTALSTSWGWLWRTDVNDPATGAAWTAAAVNNAQIGPTVTV